MLSMHNGGRTELCLGRIRLSFPDKGGLMGPWTGRMCQVMTSLGKKMKESVLVRGRRMPNTSCCISTRDPRGVMSSGKPDLGPQEEGRSRAGVGPPRYSSIHDCLSLFLRFRAHSSNRQAEQYDKYFYIGISKAQSIEM